MSTTAKLLQAASEIVGGDKALAKRLGIDEMMLLQFKSDSYRLPDRLLLHTIDILEGRSPGPFNTG